MLARLGFEPVAERDGKLEVRVPSFRGDVEREIDLIEEIARVYGFDKIPVETTMPVRAVPDQRVDTAAARIREICAGLGFCEARTSSFCPVDAGERFTHWSPQPNLIQNPISREEPALQTSLLPGLLRAKRANANKGTPQVALFELSRVYGRGPDGPFEKTCLGLLDDGGFAAVRGALDTLLDRLGVLGHVGFEPLDDANLAAGRAARIVLSGETLGVLGEISSDCARWADLKAEPAVAEVDVDRLMAAATLERRYSPLPKFPPVHRDLCVVVEAGVPWAELRKSAASAAGDLAESVEFRSEYRGEQVAANCKAVAFTVTLRAPDRTLTGSEADGAMAAVAGALKEQFGAELRA
jgi:phenylalanyl-tRNA synthetase beta chain